MDSAAWTVKFPTAVVVMTASSVIMRAMVRIAVPYGTVISAIWIVVYHTMAPDRTYIVYMPRAIDVSGVKRTYVSSAV